MTPFKQLDSASWRLQFRRRGRYVSETFRRGKDAEEWSPDIKRRIGRGETLTNRAHFDPTIFEHLIDLHIDDMRAVSKPPRRSK